MNGVVRRRGMMVSKGIETIDIDRPDYWRIDFATTEDDTVVKFGGSWTFSNPETKYIYLDGKRIYRNDGDSIRVPTAGNHTVYIKINQPYANTSNRFGIASSSLKPSYVRVPTDWISPIVYDTSGNIPIVDLLTLTPSITYWRIGDIFTIDILRVSDEIDTANIPQSWKNIANKIVQVHYNYI